jgi:predicted O-methyltransferase YrrM
LGLDGVTAAGQEREISMKLSHRLGQLAARSIARAVPKRLMCSPRFFSIWEESGYHVVPVFYESPIPPAPELPASLWQKPSEMVGIYPRTSAQLRLLEAFQSRFRSEYDAFPRGASNGGNQFHLNNGWFEKVDAEILYCMIRHFQPARMIEIGSGLTTMLSAQAILKNHEENSSYHCEFTSIEPSPVRLNPAALPPDFRFIQERVQEVPLSTFSALGVNDILFIDSSHVCRTGSDVNYEILEILPRLNKGTLVHFHDIFLPWEYPQSWVVGNHRFLSEQYMLQAYLSSNRDFEIVWGSYYMLRKRPDALDRAFTTFRTDITPPGTFLPGSFWIRRATAAPDDSGLAGDPD